MTRKAHLLHYRLYYAGSIVISDASQTENKSCNSISQLSIVHVVKNHGCTDQMLLKEVHTHLSGLY